MTEQPNGRLRREGGRGGKTKGGLDGGVESAAAKGCNGSVVRCTCLRPPFLETSFGKGGSMPVVAQTSREVGTCPHPMSIIGGRYLNEHICLNPVLLQETLD